MSTRFQKIESGKFKGLTIRAANQLCKLTSVKKSVVRAHIVSGRIHPNNHPDWLTGKMPEGQIYLIGYGWITHAEICAWVGLPDPRPKKRKHFCPHCGKEIAVRQNTIHAPHP
jgi:hypothetical protein